MNTALLIKQMEIGPMANYIYFIANQISKELVVVDPAWNVEQIRKEAQQLGYSIKAALITHGHPDHCNGINELLSSHDIPVYVSEHEAYFYKPIGENIRSVDVNFCLDLSGLSIQFLHTPGHTPGSQCFLVEGNLVSGDTLFLDGCGRCDLPGGDAEVMYDTIHHKLMRLPDSTIIYPGHNYHHLNCDSLEHQKLSNPYMRCSKLKDFLRTRC